MPASPASGLYQLIWQTRRLFQRLRATSDEMLEDKGINSGQRAMLEFLYQKQPQTVPQMAREKSVSRQHVQTLVNSLLELEFIEAVENPGHKRSPLLKLTKTGERLFELIQKEEEALIEVMKKKFSSKDLTTTLTTLKVFDDYLASGDWKRKGKSS